MNNIPLIETNINYVTNIKQYCPSVRGLEAKCLIFRVKLLIYQRVVIHDIPMDNLSITIKRTYEIIQGVEKPYPLVNIYMTMEIHHF